MHDSWLDFPPFVCIADAYWSCTRRHDLFRFVTWHHRRNKRVESVMESSKSVQTRNHSNDCKYCAVIRPQNLSLIFLQEQNFQLVISENVNDDFKNPRWINICLVRFFKITFFFSNPMKHMFTGQQQFPPHYIPPKKHSNMTMKTSTNSRCLCFLLVQWGIFLHVKLVNSGVYILYLEFPIHCPTPQANISGNWTFSSFFKGGTTVRHILTPRFLPQSFRCRPLRLHLHLISWRGKEVTGCDFCGEDRVFAGHEC